MRRSPRAPATCLPRGALAHCRTFISGSTGPDRRAIQLGKRLDARSLRGRRWLPPRNLGPHGLDMFLHLTGEETQVTGAQLSRRAHERAVEDYASVMLRSAATEPFEGWPRIKSGSVSQLVTSPCKRF